MSLSSSLPDKFVRIKFHNNDMRQVPSINLNSSNLMKSHKVYKNVSDEKYVIKTALENDQRVLTLRTQFVLINKNELTYKVRIFWYEKEKKKVHVL